MWIHLAITVYFYNNIYSILDGLFVCSADCAANSLILCVENDADPWIFAVLSDPLAASVRAKVIHGVDLCHIIRYFLYDTKNMLLDFIARYGNCYFHIKSH